jgi:pimeloyl-ACP methyl ester carboxylesterase
MKNTSSPPADLPVVHHSETINGIALHYVTAGQGEPVILWHGFLETWYHWRKIIPILAEDYTVVAFDMRGYGDSDKPSKAVDLQTLVDDCRGLLNISVFKSSTWLPTTWVRRPPYFTPASTPNRSALSLTWMNRSC